MAITDHHSLKGGQAVKKANRDKSFEVIPGVEISTDAGDVLAYYVTKPIKSREFYSVVEEVKKQNGLITIPHPFRVSTNPNHHFKIPFKEITKKVDAIEGFNARMLSNSSNEKAQKEAKKVKMSMTGGSDGHFFFEVGQGFTKFDGSLRDALKKGKTTVGGKIGFGAFGGLCSFVKRRLP